MRDGRCCLNLPEVMETIATPERSARLVWRSLCSRLWLRYALMAVLLSALVVSLASVALTLEKRRYHERAIVATQDAAHQFEQQIRSVLGRADVVLRGVAVYYSDMVAAGAVDAVRLNRFLAGQQAGLPEISSLRVTDRAGIVRYGRDIPQDASVDLSDREYFRIARDNPGVGTIVSGPVFARITKKWVVITARRLDAPDGSFAGVAYANLPCEQLESILGSGMLGSHGAASVRMADLALVYRFPDTKGAIGSREVSSQLLDVIKANPDGGGYVAVTKLDGIERSNAYRRVQPYPLYVIVGLATDDYLGDWRNNLFVISGLAGLTLVVIWYSLFRVYLTQCRLRADVDKRTQIGHALEQVLAERTQLYAELEQRKNALEAVNATLEQKVAERTEELSRANLELERLARRDALTRVGNRLSADEHLREEFLRMKRTGVAYSLLMVDIDHFKLVNDTLGHGQGDRVLQRVAEILGHSCRATDFVARFGGEEFLVILPDTPVARAMLVAQKMRAAIEGADMAPVARVTVSIGVACAAPAQADETEALRAADRELYRAKEGGRNCVMGRVQKAAEIAD